MTCSGRARWNRRSDGVTVPGWLPCGCAMIGGHREWELFKGLRRSGWEAKTRGRNPGGQVQASPVSITP